MKAKIYGAGSIGNHLAQACRRTGWDVVVVDPDPKALERMKSEIYPTRYGAWDEKIILCEPPKEPKGGFDVIFIGTPPEYHLSIATTVLKEEAPRVLQIEKPLSATTLDGLQEFLDAVRKSPKTQIVVGFDHVLGENTLKTEQLLAEQAVGKIVTIDSETRSSWSGILKAHPWLTGPGDSYLGHWKKGGGASGEHSHALNLWQHFAHHIGAGRVKYVQAVLDYVKDEKVDYDRICFLELTTEKGLIGRVVQDVVTNPKRKSVLLQGDKGRVEWYCDITKTLDEVHLLPSSGDPIVTKLPKTRPDEFFREIQHIDGLLSGKIKYENSPIRLQRGLDTMMVLNAAHRSFKDRKLVEVEYLY